MEQSETTFTPEQLGELLERSRSPGGVLAPDQLRALIAWSGTSDNEREALKSSLASTTQQVEAKPLAPTQRRGHVSLLDRIRGFIAR